MKPPSLTQRIKAYFQKHPDEWINGYVIEQLAIKATHIVKGKRVNFKGSTASRRMREAESGIGSNGKPCEIFLEADHKRGSSVWYKYKPKEVKVSVPIYQDNGSVKIIQQTIFK